MKIRALVLVGLSFAAALTAQNTVKIEDLPAPVQETVRNETKNAKLLGVAQEGEKGKTLYRVETRVGDKGRDLVVNPAGKITAVEEEISINAVPGGAREVIDKKAAGGQIKRVEMVVALGETEPFYQVEIESKGKISEFNVKANGSKHK
jgi:uncharacterized membrane protein YkoI